MFILAYPFIDHRNGRYKKYLCSRSQLKQLFLQLCTSDFASVVMIAGIRVCVRMVQKFLPFEYFAKGDKRMDILFLIFILWCLNFFQ